MADNKENIKRGESIMEEYLRITSQVPELNPASNNGLKVGETDAIKSNLKQAEHDWVYGFDAYKVQKKTITDTLNTFTSEKYEAPEAYELRKELLNIEYLQSLHTKAGRENPFTQHEADKKKYDIRYNEDKINGMVYSNDGQSPRPDLSKPSVARWVYISEKIDDVKNYLQGAKEGANNIAEAIKPYAREAARAIGATVIDSELPTPSKLLPLPKTPYPHMDNLRDGTIDGASSRAGIQSFGNKTMDNILGPPPSAHKNRVDNPFGQHSSLDENINPNSINVQMAEAFRNQTPNDAVKTFPVLKDAYGLQAAIQKQVETGGYNAKEHEIVMSQVNGNIASKIEIGQIPQVNITERNVSTVPSKELEMGGSRGFA